MSDTTEKKKRGRPKGGHLNPRPGNASYKSKPTVKRKPLKHNAKYDKKYDKIAYNFMSMGGNACDLITLLGVHKNTYYNWLSAEQSFNDAVTNGRRESIRKVENALYNLAIGQAKKHTQVKRRNKQGELQVVETREEIQAPSEKAITQWLYNKDPENWKQGVDTNVSVNIENKITNEDIKAAEKAIEGELDNLIDIPDLDDNNDL